MADPLTDAEIAAMVERADNARMRPVSLPLSEIKRCGENIDSLAAELRATRTALSDRDRLWCRALIEMLPIEDINAVTTWMVNHRPSITETMELARACLPAYAEEATAGKPEDK